jgi:hypothetical protein
MVPTSRTSTPKFIELGESANGIVGQAFCGSIPTPAPEIRGGLQGRYGFDHEKFSQVDMTAPHGFHPIEKADSLDTEKGPRAPCGDQYEGPRGNSF